MAAIQKIRSYGVLLIVVVGLALFAFIAEELVRALSTTRNIGRQVVGEVFGESLNYPEFNSMYEEYENAMKMGNGGQNLTDVQMVQLRDQVWNEYVANTIIEHEAHALGLQVTDAEVQMLINTGSSPLLNQTPFINQQTRTFDANMLKQFLANYDEVMNNPDYPESEKEIVMQLMKYWQFVEKQVRQLALAQKYQTLLGTCLLSNPISAADAFQARNTESTILLAAIPFSTIKDTDVPMNDKELKEKYSDMSKQYPDMFDLQQETRNIKYISVQVKASKADEQALYNELTEYRAALDSGEFAAGIVREARSLVSYSGLPVSKSSLPADVASRIDSLAVGETTEPFTTSLDNTMNIVKLIAKTQLPDSVEFRRLDIAGVDEQAMTTVDSVMTVLNAGVPMDSVAKNFNQAADAQWVSSAQVDNTQLNEENRDFITQLFTTPAGTFKKVSVTGGTIIINIVDRRNMIDKFDVAIIKRSIDFSDDTHSDVWNAFSSFLAANPTQAEIEENASKSGYVVRDLPYITSNAHYIANIYGSTEALRWLFDKAKQGDVSDLYECGKANDELLVVMLTDINKKGPRDINDPNIRSILEQDVLKDKKAAQILAQEKDAKSVAEVAKMAGAVEDTITHITFSSPVFVQKVASSEAGLSGAVAAAKQGDFVNGVRGDNSIFAFQVLQKTTNDAQMDAPQEQAQLENSYARNLNGLMPVLVRKANIKDNRYKFYQ